MTLSYTSLPGRKHYFFEQTQIKRQKRKQKTQKQCHIQLAYRNECMKYITTKSTSVLISDLEFTSRGWIFSVIRFLSSSISINVLYSCRCLSIGSHCSISFALLKNLTRGCTYCKIDLKELFIGQKKSQRSQLDHSISI